MDLKARIAAAREQLDSREPVVAPVDLGGELADVTLKPLEPQVWLDMVAANPPRTASTDMNIGFNQDRICRDYPADRILVDGEPVDVETWQALFDVLASPSIRTVTAAAWSLNHNEADKRLRELGKARLAASQKKRPSRSTSASRSNGSKGGSRQK